MRRISTILAFAIVALLLLTPMVSAGKPVDADGDGYKSNVDCDDTNPAVNPGATEICDDGIDNDCNGLIDGADPTCGTCTITEPVEVSCSDGLDNDCDGLTDGADPDCPTSCSSITSQNECLADASCEWIGNKKTGYCQDATTCTPTENPEVSCTDGIDNDCDGLTDAADPDCSTGGDYVIMAYNDLGMHCVCPRPDIMMLLPPWNTLRAQVIDKTNGGLVVTNDNNALTLEYNIRENCYGGSADCDLSTDSQYNAWLDSASQNFPGSTISRSNPVGLAGFGLSGHMEPHNFGSGRRVAKSWIAEGIPAFPKISNQGEFVDLYGDTRKAYLHGDLTLKDANTGAVLATTTTTVPVANGGCCNCHLQVSIDNGYVKTGQSQPDEYDSFQAMMEMHARDTGVDVLNQLAQPTYDADGHLTDTGMAIRCSKCHTDAAVGGDAALDNSWVNYGKSAGGVSSISTFSKVLHGFHAQDPEVLTMDPSITNNCYQCHPGGGQLDCYRGHHSDKVNNGVNLWCSDCHGDLNYRLTDGSLEAPWDYTTLPDCVDCHGNNYNGGGTPGLFGVYLGSSGHKNDAILCSSCHGQPHALQPSALGIDNEQNLALQGDARAIGVCDVCHTGRSTSWGIPPH